MAADDLLALSSIDIIKPHHHHYSVTMCIDIYDQYLDCEKDHTIETYRKDPSGHTSSRLCLMPIHNLDSFGDVSVSVSDRRLGNGS